ncbi:hypothetical protein Fmac_029937 [Flemingia macrophylla]|uniref:PHD-type domain-containing protein n=1 Tax=Flemingia macrophylla TaxID=520843 RepID=A0ABD1LBQ7_9FABA
MKIREECPCRIAVDFNGYNMIKMGECSSGMEIDLVEGNPGNLNEQNRLVGVQQSHPQDNLFKDRILGLELIARFQRRTRGHRRLTQIHGVSMANEVEDMCTSRSLRKEVLEELVNSQSRKENKTEEVIPADRECTPERLNANVQNEQNSDARTIRARRRQQQQQLQPLQQQPKRQLKATVLSWMIEMRVIGPRARVSYMDHERKCVLLNGEIDGGKIRCGCCSESVSMWEFEAHAKTKVCDPLKNICVTKGKTPLLQCLTQAWNQQDEHGCNFYYSFQNGDVCDVCGEGGNEQIRCDSCFSVFHQTCLELERVPSGIWNCMYCRCKFCGLYGEKQNERSMSACDHKSCLEASGANTVHSMQELCGNECRVVSERLESILGRKYAIAGGFSWSFIRRLDIDSNTSQIEPTKVEYNCKLGVAYSVLKGCFAVYTDATSGINVMRNVVYNCGSNLTRLNYKRFFTAILEKDDEIVCVATIRIHGNQVAEMPYVGTLSSCRRKGMLSRLMKRIELALRYLNVELLIIPSMLQVKDTWIRSFGFEPLDSRSKTLIKDVNMLVFSGTVTLQKKIPKQEFS